jgi:hypothetical protein
MNGPSYVCVSYLYDFTRIRSVYVYIKEYILFQIAQNIRLHSLTSSMRLNEMNLLKCVLEIGRNERK